MLYFYGICIKTHDTVAVSNKWYLIRDEKGYINFWHKAVPFPEKWLNAFPEQFFAVSLENNAFSEKIVQPENI